MSAPPLLPQPSPVEVERVEWGVATPDAITVRVVGARRAGGPAPAAVLVVGETRFAPTSAPGGGPEWRAAFLVPGALRGALEAGEALLELGPVRLALPGAVPGAAEPPDAPAATVVDPGVLAARRARRGRGASAEQAAATLRTRLGQVEERLAEAERRVRRAEQAAEAERRRRDELEAETGGAVRVGYERLERLRAALGAAEASREELRAELRRVRAQAAAGPVDPGELARLRAQLAARPGPRELAALRDELARVREESTRLRARLAAAPTVEELARVRDEVVRLRDQLAAAPDPGEHERLRGELGELRATLAGAPEPGELERLRGELAAVMARHERELAAYAEAVRAAIARRDAAVEEAEALRADLEDARADAPGAEDDLRAGLEAVAAEVRALREELAGARTDDRERAIEARGEALEEALVARDAELAETRAALDDARELVATLRRAGEDEPVLRSPALEALLAGLRAPEASEAPEAPAHDPVAGLDDATRARLEALEGELREAAPRPLDAGLAGGLAEAAARLRAAAPEGGGEPEAPARELPDAAVVAPAAAVVPAPAAAVVPAPAVLAARAVPPRAAEGPWLRVALERLAAADPVLAARLLVALLPAQAAVAADLTYDVAVTGAAPVRVTLAHGRGAVDPAPPAGPIDFAVAGDVRALAPLAAGGAGRWRLRGARVSGSRRRLRALLRARRARVGLADLAAAGLALEPALVLAALVAATPPQLTRGQSFGVAYAVDDEAFEVRAADGAPLTLTPGRTTRVAAIVDVAAAALVPVLAGGAPAAPRPATVTGDPVAVDLLHGWFDAARGVAAR